MAKRFIDTELFNDPWFIDLSKEGKIGWIYFITRCNHAGIIEISERLFKIQTGCDSLDRVIEQLKNRIITVREKVFFIPKFITYQYPGFPHSKAKAQASAISILKKTTILNKENITVFELFNNSYNNGNGKDYDNNNNKNARAHEELMKDEVAYESFCMKYKSKVEDWDDLLHHFSNKVDVEGLEWEPKKLWARLDSFTLNWIKNQKGGAGKFPDVYDREFEKNLPSDKLPAYWQHLRSKGWEKQQTGSGVKVWKRPKQKA